LAFEKPRLLFAIMAVGAADVRARSGQLFNGSLETTYTERDLLSRSVPDFVGFKLKAIRILNQRMSVVEEATDASTIFAVVCLLAIEVRLIL